MHEYSLMADLLRKILRIADENKAERVTSVKVKLGALSHITKEHFTEHFEEAIRGTVAQGAVLCVEQMTSQTDPNAQDILLESIDVYRSDDGSPYEKGVGVLFANSGEHG
jgi:hydrogenase nickel incorporation protein HypA/HybF